MLKIGDDNELDNLSREAAEKYRVPATANWELMQAELDKHLPVEEKKRRFLFWWLLPGILLGGTMVFLILNRDGHIASDKKSPSALLKTIDTKEAVKPAIGIDNNTSKTNQPVLEQKSGELTSGTTIATEKKNAYPKMISGQEKQKTTVNNTSQSPAQSFQNNNNHTSNPVADKKTLTEPATNRLVTREAASETQNTNKNNEQTKAADLPVVTNGKTESKNETTENKDNNNKPLDADSTQTTVSNSSPEPATVKINKANGWSIAFLAGVDKSTVKFRYDNGPGYNTGLLLGYHFNKKLSLHTGAIYTQKNYKVAGTDFHPPKGSWASFYSFSQVNGYCRMWEVPLLLRYYLGNNNGSTGFFLSTGLSSYFMTREKYTYYYLYNGQPAQRTNTYPSSDTHLLSILHLSAGLDKQLNKKWSVLLEPYAKIPLGGVGFGNIQLSSFGINLSLHYRQPARK